MSNSPYAIEILTQFDSSKIGRREGIVYTYDAFNWVITHCLFGVDVIDDPKRVVKHLPTEQSKFKIAAT